MLSIDLRVVCCDQTASFCNIKYNRMNLLYITKYNLNTSFNMDKTNKGAQSLEIKQETKKYRDF